MVILKENFKWHLEAFASELFIYPSSSCPPSPWWAKPLSVNYVLDQQKRGQLFAQGHTWAVEAGTHMNKRHSPDPVKLLRYYLGDLPQLYL